MVGLRWANGWAMVDKWLAQMFGQGLANGWPMHDMDLFFSFKEAVPGIKNDARP